EIIELHELRPLALIERTAAAGELRPGRNGKRRACCQDRKRDCKTPVRCCHPVKTRYQRKVWPLAPSHETGSWHPHPFARHIPTSAIWHAPSAAPSYTTTQGLSIRQITSICGSGPEGGGPNRAQPRFLDEAQFPSNQAAARRGKVLPLRLRRGAYAATTAMISTSIRK